MPSLTLLDEQVEHLLLILHMKKLGVSMYIHNEKDGHHHPHRNTIVYE